MAKLLLGKEVTDALNANLQARTAALREKGIIPTLGIVRVGADPSDLSYEKGATKRAELVGVDVKKFEPVSYTHLAHQLTKRSSDVSRLRIFLPRGFSSGKFML